MQAERAGPQSGHTVPPFKKINTFLKSYCTEEGGKKKREKKAERFDSFGWDIISWLSLSISHVVTVSLKMQA